jgi:hypothetical protein
MSHQNYTIANLLIYYGADETKTNNKGLNPWRCINVALNDD